MEVTKAGLREIVKGLNVFILFQFMWILTINFFVINSLIELFSEFQNIEFVGLPFRNFIFKYNELIIKFFSENSDALLYLSMILFLTGLVVSIITQALFSKYNFINAYGSFGIYAAIWIFIIICTYQLYCATGKYYAVFLGIGFLIILHIKTTERYEKVRNFLTNSY